MRKNLKELFDLKGKVIILIGSSGLLGPEYADILSEAGADVVLVDLKFDESVKLKEELRKKYNTIPSAYTMDSSDEKQVKALVDDVIKKYKKIDILINNAVLHHVDYPEDMCKPFEESSLKIWNDSLQHNLTNVYLCCREIGKQMVKQGYGNIINIASIYGMIGADQRIYEDVDFNLPAGYAATKGAILNLTRYLASYWRGKNIRVNTLSPGGVWVEEKHGPKFRDNYSYRTCIGRMADSWDYRGAMLFLCSDASEYVNGANIVVDGGWTAC